MAHLRIHPDAVDAAKDQLRKWRRDPVRFVTECLGAVPDCWQEEGLRAYGDAGTQRVAVKSSAGPGKTAFAAWCGWHFMSCYPYPKCAATAITYSNLKDNLWTELAKWRGRSAFLKAAFDWTQQKVFARQHPDRWWISARSWSRDADPQQQAQTLSGLHEDYVLILVDEAGGIPDAVVEAGERALSTTGGVKKMVIVGNPTHLEGPLFRAFTSDRDLWHLIEVTSDPDDPNRSARVDKAWAEEQIRKHGGRSSPWVRVFILGRFPLGVADALVPLGKFEDAFARWETGVGDDGAPISRGIKTLGVDVARGGDDNTVVFKRDGGWIDGCEFWHGMDTEYTADEVSRIFEEYGREKANDEEQPREVLSVNVDDIGVGGGVTDKLARRGLPVKGVDVGSPAFDQAKYRNLRAELSYGELRLKYFFPGAIALHPSLRDTPLAHQGSTLKYEFGEGNRIKVERKEIYKKRQRQSPDFWDSLMLSVAGHVDLSMMGWQ